MIIAGGQSDAGKSGFNAHQCVSLRKVGDERLERRDVRVAGLPVVDDFLQGNDQILRLLLRRRRRGRATCATPLERRSPPSQTNSRRASLLRAVSRPSGAACGRLTMRRQELGVPAADPDRESRLDAVNFNAAR